ncbi:uncharacterized protein BJ171DRAFT_500711 [Polychytrium aggregatum]|uniref:uncharacterized protein n=1 Tax=Polychytrium aggregatum TaxID=110093 RepID=UPI0022FEC8E8|nr:uncharacterized protein BJ171DRAFT_500711 [Polychytrium aggregatum]KAI9205529.1 hypothetical protein BJ171DRAFT_500711 [Polychytrium aggregatum]
MSGTGDQGDSRSLHVIVSLSMSKLMKRGTQGIEACKLFAATSLLGPDNIPYGLIKAIAAEMKLTGPATALATLLGQSGLIRLGADDNYHTHSLIQQVAQQFSESTHELAFSEVINATGSAMLSFEKTLGLKAHSLSEHFEHYAAKAIPETYSAQMHAEIEKALAMQLSDKALYGAAISVFERNLRRSEILFETRLNPLVGTILKEMGDTMHAMGRLDQAMECLNESLHITILCFGTRNNPQTPPILNSIGGLKRSTGDLSDALECFQEAEDIMANSSTGKCERILGQIVGNIGLVSKSKGLFIQAFDEYEQATQLEQIDSGNSQSLSRAVNLNNMSPIARYQGRYDEAIKLCQDSLEIKKKIFDTEDHPGIAKTYQNLGLIMRDKGDLHESLRYFTKSIDIFKAVYKTNEHIDIAGVLTNIGVIESELEHHDSAFRHHQEALDILKNIQGYQTHPLYLIIMQNIALEMDSQGQLKDALNRLKELKELHLNLKENMSQNDYARVLYNIGKVAYSMGSIYEAKDYIAEGIKVTSKIHGTRVNPDLALANCTMAKILSDLGDSCRGLQLCQECLSIFEHIYGTRKHAVIARILSIMGGIASAAWQFDDAVQHYRDSIAIFEHISEAQYSSSIVSLLVGLGFVLSEQKNYDQAHSCFLKALKICREIGEPQGYLPTATVLNGIGVTLINRGRLDEAQSKLQEALNVCKNVKGDRRFPVMTAAIQNLGTVARKQDKPQEALKYFRDAQMIMKSNGFGNAITHSANLEMIAKIEHKCGDHESALRDYQEAVDILVKFFNTKSHEKVVQAMCNVLSIRVYFKNYRESDALAQEIISIMEKLLGSRHHALIAHALIHQGISAKANNSHECAWKYLQEGHDILVKLNDEEYMCHLSVALRAMGELSYSKRNLKMAFKLFEEAMTTSVKANGTRNHIDSVNILNLMATVADDEGYHEKSTNLYSEALRILKTLDGNHEKEIARVLSNLGYCTLKGGDFDLSFRYYEQSLDYWERAYGTRNTPDAAECLRSMAMAKALSRDEEGAQRFTHQFKEIMHAIQNDGQTVSGEYVALRFRRAGM